MTLEISNNRLKIDLNMPGEEYNGSRFDWSGQIIQVTLDEKYTFCVDEKYKASTFNNIGRGLYTEFGILLPVGYIDCKPNDWFPKIGVGLLQRISNDEYNFWEDYAKKPFNIEFETSCEKVSFTSHPFYHRGYGFLYKKDIEINENQLSIGYFLKNTGDYPIITHEYCHNFMGINNHLFNSDYELIFNDEINKNAIVKFVDPDDMVKFQRYGITWRGNSPVDYYFSNITGISQIPDSWQLIHRREKVGIRNDVDFLPAEMNIWGNKHVTSPEIFKSIELNPGESDSWERKYEFFQL